MKKLKRNLTIMLILALIFPTFPCTRKTASAASPRLSAKSITMKAGQTKTIKLLNIKKKAKWSIEDEKIRIISKTRKQVKFKAVEEGTTKVYALVGKKEYKCKITIKSKTSKNTSVPAPTVNPVPKPAVKPMVAPAEENLSGKIEILAKYTLPDSIGWYTRHFVVIKNNSNSTVDISTSSLAYSKDGKMVSAANSSFGAFGSGCTSVFYEAFETSEEIDHYDMDMSVKPSEYYASVTQNLSYVQNNIEDGAIFQVTNNGKSPAEFVEGYALFFLGDRLVSFDSTYFTDDDSEIKSGKTISKQITSYQDFDRIEFYLTGRR